MLQRMTLALMFLAALSAYSVPRADATIIIKKTLTQLAAESERIVEGKVVERTAAYAPGTGIIFTHYRLRIARNLKGKAVESLVVSEVGGTVGDITQRVAGMPQYALGETVLLMLKKDALGHWRTHGLSQGAFRMNWNPAAKDWVIRLDRGLAHVWSKEVPKDLRSATDTVALDDFEDVVADLVAKGAKKKEKK